MKKKQIIRTHTGQKIYEARKAEGLTQVELAQKLGVSQQLITFWENTGKAPTAEMIIKISQTLNLSADDLLGLTEKKAEHPEYSFRLEKRFNSINQLSRRKQERILSVIDTLLEDSVK